jgi:hypothetical protein
MLMKETLAIDDVRWNAPTEVVHQLGYDCPVFRRTKRWLGNEKSRKISCLSRVQLKRLKELETENQRLKRVVADLSLDKMILMECPHRVVQCNMCANGA